jgi:hypothetical protein
MLFVLRLKYGNTQDKLKAMIQLKSAMKALSKEGMFFSIKNQS